MSLSEEKLRTKAFINELARQRNEALMDLANAMGEIAVLREKVAQVEKSNSPIRKKK